MSDVVVQLWKEPDPKPIYLYLGFRKRLQLEILHIVMLHFLQANLSISRDVSVNFHLWLAAREVTTLSHHSRTEDGQYFEIFYEEFLFSLSFSPEFQ